MSGLDSFTVRLKYGLQFVILVICCCFSYKFGLIHNSAIHVFYLPPPAPSIDYSSGVHWSDECDALLCVPTNYSVSCIMANGFTHTIEPNWGEPACVIPVLKDKEKKILNELNER